MTRGLLLLALAGAASAAGCGNFYAGNTDPDVASAKRWCAEGDYFTFKSPANGNREAQVFYRCAAGAAGGEGNQRLVVLGHGWPTSSYDFQPLSGLLQAEGYRVCALDYVGAGFSDKPTDWAYHIRDHAETIHAFVTLKNETSFAYLTHDEGSSVGFAFLEKYATFDPKPYEIAHHFILDGSVYLPLANLSSLQEALLSNTTGPIVQKLITPKVFATGLGSSVFTPPLNPAETAAYASTFAYQGGTHVLHQTIQYLVDRKNFEDRWLDVLHASPVDATLIWGVNDPVAKIDIADYVWSNYLKDRPNARAAYHKLDANHYLQVGNATDIAGIVLKDLAKATW